MLDYLQSYQALLIYEYIEKIFIKVSFEPHMVLVSKKPSSFLDYGRFVREKRCSPDGRCQRLPKRCQRSGVHVA